MNRHIKFAGRILAILLVFLGVIWILQGVNVLPGSFMTGQIQWAYRGGVLAIIGLVLLFVLRRRRS
jgi:MYXO-CTERM domain-containing protein